MRAVQKHSTPSETQTTTEQPVQRHTSMRGLGYDEAVQRLAPVQAKEDTNTVHAAAQRGTSGGGGSLPYAAQIQHAFGSHDVSGISAHVGGKATEACDAMGAEAYASGSSVAFKGQPDLHTAAHEAAHIVQQRAGVQLSGGVGQVGDSYEKNADAVADRVVQGKSAEDLLGGASWGGAASVQRSSIQLKEQKGIWDRIKAYFLEAKLTGPQQEVAKILLDKHGVDVSGLPNGTFTSLYNDAMAGDSKKSPDKIAAAMASAARDHLSLSNKKPTQKKAHPGVVSGVSVQRKESRHVQRSASPVQQNVQMDAKTRAKQPAPKYTAAQLAQIKAQVTTAKKDAKTHLELVNSQLQSIAKPLLSLSSAINGLVAHLEKIKGQLIAIQVWTTHMENIGSWTTKLADAKTIISGRSDMLGAVLTAPRFLGGSAMELAGASGEVGLMFGWVTSITPFAAAAASGGAKAGVLSLLGAACDTANYFLAKQNEARQGQIDKLEVTLLTLQAKRTALSHGISQITSAQASITAITKTL